MKSLWILAFGLMLPLLAACNGPSEVADPANPKSGASASTKQPLPGDPDTNDVGGQQTTAVEVAVVEPPTGPEDALKHFLSAMITGDEAGLHAASVDNPELFMLWLGPTLPATHQAAKEKALLKSAQFRRLRVGETVDIPGSGKMTMTTEHVNANRQQLVHTDSPTPFVLVKQADGSPIPFILAKEADGWKVDPSPIIAGRKAVAAAREKAQAADPKTWSPNAQLINQLDPETSAGGLKIRAPAGYKFHDKSNQATKTLIWEGPPKKDETFAGLVILEMPVPADPAERLRPLESLLAETLNSIKQRRENWAAEGVEYGRVGNLDFVRTRWSGVCKVGRQQMVGKAMRGVIYVAKRRGNVLVIMVEDTAPFDTDTLSVCEAAALTLR